MNDKWRKIICYGLPPIIILTLVGLLFLYQRRQQEAQEAVPSEPTPSHELSEAELPFPNEPDPEDYDDAETASQKTEPADAKEVVKTFTMEEVEGQQEEIGGALSDNELWKKWMKTPALVEHAVKALEEVANGERPMSLASLLRLELPFEAERREDGKWVQTEASKKRYETTVKVFCSIQPEGFASMYRKMEPVLQRLLEKLGYRDMNFRHMVDKAYQVLMELPVPDEEPTLLLIEGLEKPIYQWEDTTLEDLNDAQKLLLRLGMENMQAVRNHCRALYSALPQPTDAPAPQPKDAITPQSADAPLLQPVEEPAE